MTTIEFCKNLVSISVCISWGILVMPRQDIAANPEYSGLAKGALGVFS
ncbi:MAG: hypothetical protein ACKO3K_09480 [Cuspidothrix sp.]